MKHTDNNMIQTKMKRLSCSHTSASEPVKAGLAGRLACKAWRMLGPLRPVLRLLWRLLYPVRCVLGPIGRTLRIHRDERWVALAVALAVAALNALLICHYWDKFTLPAPQGFHGLFLNNFHVSGFDAHSYIVLSCEDIYFNTFRHPLFFTLLWPFFWLNTWVMQWTGLNISMFIMAAMQVVAAVYGVLFMLRALTQVVGLRRGAALWLCLWLYGFGHVMLSALAPDHFGLSLPLLAGTVWIAGRQMKSGRQLGCVRQGILFFLTAGVTLTNGVKTCLAAWVTDGRRVFGWRNVVSFAVPAVLLMGIWAFQYEVYEVPQKERIDQMIAKVRAKSPEKVQPDSAHVQWVRQQNGRPLKQDNLLLQWSDISTPRWPSVVHNLFGESVLLHRQYLLQDVQQSRPVFVPYRHWAGYVPGALCALLLVAGLLAGWLSGGVPRRLALMLCAWLLFDGVMHIGFGFGLNEVQIMATHWMLAIPLATAFLLRRLEGRRLGRWLFTLVQCLALATLCYNATLVYIYFAQS